MNRNQRLTEAPLTLTVTFLYRAERSIKIKDPVFDQWIPISQIIDSDPAVDEMEEGETVTIEIPFWLAVEKGLIE